MNSQRGHRDLTSDFEWPEFVNERQRRPLFFSLSSSRFLLSCSLLRLRVSRHYARSYRTVFTVSRVHRGRSITISSVRIDTPGHIEKRRTRLISVSFSLSFFFHRDAMLHFLLWRDVKRTAFHIRAFRIRLCELAPRSRVLASPFARIERGFQETHFALARGRILIARTLRLAANPACFSFFFLEQKKQQRRRRQGRSNVRLFTAGVLCNPVQIRWPSSLFSVA